jgi:hypothetical protein
MAAIPYVGRRHFKVFRIIAITSHPASNLDDGLNLPLSVRACIASVILYSAPFAAAVQSPLFHTSVA